jgi:hypothetical protein
MDLEVSDNLQRPYDFAYAAEFAVRALVSLRSADMVGWRKTLLCSRELESSNGHDYRKTNITPQLRENPSERVQLTILLKRENEESESGTFMPEFESDDSESQDTEFAVLSDDSFCHQGCGRFHTL